MKDRIVTVDIGVDNPMKYSLISKKRIIKNFVVTFFTNPFEIIRFLFNDIVFK